MEFSFYSCWSSFICNGSVFLVYFYLNKDSFELLYGLIRTWFE